MPIKCKREANHLGLALHEFIGKATELLLRWMSARPCGLWQECALMSATRLTAGPRALLQAFQEVDAQLPPTCRMLSDCHFQQPCSQDGQGRHARQAHRTAERLNLAGSQVSSSFLVDQFLTRHYPVADLLKVKLKGSKLVDGICAVESLHEVPVM